MKTISPYDAPYNVWLTVAACTVFFALEAAIYNVLMHWLGSY